MAWIGEKEEVVWGPTGVVMALFVVAEILLAYMTIAFGNAHGGAMMLGAAAAAFASIIFITLSAMPDIVKTVLTLAVAATLLLLAATLDPLGAEGVQTEAVATIDRPDTAPPPQEASSSALRIVSTEVTGTAADQRFATDLSRRVAADLGNRGDVPAMTASIDIAPGRDGPTYRLGLSLSRHGTARWCGRVTITSPAREVVLATLSRWIIAAVDGRNDEASGCA